MTQITVISQDQVKQLASMPEVLNAVENAFIHQANNQVEMPSKIYVELPQFEGDFRAMPAYDDQYKVAGIKWVNSHRKNREKNLPAVMATLLLNDPQTGELTAIIEASALTAIRTGAAGGIASKVLARSDAHSAAFIGCGVQAHYQADAILLTRDITEIHLYDPFEKAMSEFKQYLENKTKASITCHTSAQDCVKNADIITTTTPGTAIVLKADWVKPGTHINAIGADAQGKQELDPKILQNARVIVDDIEQASHSGEINIPLHDNTFSADQIAATLGQVLTAQKQGRLSDNDITVFDSTGLAVQDLATGWLVYQKAKQSQQGITVNL